MTLACVRESIYNLKYAFEVDGSQYCIASDQNRSLFWYKAKGAKFERSTVLYYNSVSFFSAVNSWAYPKVGSATWPPKLCVPWASSPPRVKTSPSPRPVMSMPSVPYGSNFSPVNGLGDTKAQKPSCGWWARVWNPVCQIYQRPGTLKRSWWCAGRLNRSIDLILPICQIPWRPFQRNGWPEALPTLYNWLGLLSRLFRQTRCGGVACRIKNDTKCWLQWVIMLMNLAF